MSERKVKMKGVWKPTVPFFFSPVVKYIYLQPLWKAHKAAWQLKTCFLYVRISLCDTQGKCYFLPPTVVYGKQVSKTTSVSKAELIKVTIRKVRALIFRSLSAVWQSKICLCDSGRQLSHFEMWMCKMYATQESRWISQPNLPIIKLYRHTESRGVRPNYYAFEKHWCYARLIQNGGWCRE